MTSPSSYLAPASRLGFFTPPRICVWPTRLRGLKVLIKPQDWSETLIFEEIFLYGAYNLSSLPFTPDQIIDCGAHIGMFSLLASALYPSSKLTVFEPNPQNFGRILEQRAANGLSWECRCEAVGPRAGSLRLQVVHSHLALLNEKEGVPTAVVCLADYIKQMGDKCLLLKLDVEGQEQFMWQGLIPVLPTKTALFFETHHGQEGWELASKALKSHGFHISKCRDMGQCIDGFAWRVQA